MFQTSRVNGERYAQITGWGMYVPERVMTNAELETMVDTSDEWIVRMTGVQERHVCAPDRESTATLGLRAARSALSVADIAPNQLDLVIVATATPEYMFPSTACILQDALGASNAGAFDLSAGCSGFIYGLNMASNVIRAGNAQHVLVVGAETLSKITDWTDRNTCVLFGDGAGAVVLSACDERCGVMSYVLGSDGSGGELLMVPAGGSKTPASIDTVSNGGHFIHMNGREVFRFATQVMAKATEAAIEKAGWALDEISLVLPHQANTRIIESAAKRLNLPLDRFFINLERFGNTSSASIPIALCEAIGLGRVKPGDKVVLVGFGAGLTWAATALEWGIPVPLKRRRLDKQATSEFWFAFAPVRSFGLRVARRLYNLALGPEGGESWRGRIRERIDEWRRHLGDR